MSHALIPLGRFIDSVLGICMGGTTDGMGGMGVLVTGSGLRAAGPLVISAPSVRITKY
jgi:hypothetical protein